ncbi:MAG: short-chain dehydrogenase/reductase [Acidimicrobiales bacterium]|nr:short-chain dehydrogenase/reductase [Acidimicrobiales bacterium]
MARELGTVIVTGGSSGLGAAVAAGVAERGGTPVVLDRRPPSAGHAYEEVDLADSKDAEGAVRRAAEAHGLDAVVTCAGIDVPGALADVPTETWERVVAVNLLGTAAVVRAALPWLQRSHGRIVTVTSTLGHRAADHATAYCASKFGVVGFTRALMAELKGQVGVTLLTPGGMATAFFDDRAEQYKPGPDARLCDPADVAAGVLLALAQPRGAEIKELVIAAPTETSWP